MEYLTFVSRKGVWQLYQGVGDQGVPVAQGQASLSVQDMSAAAQPWLWLCGQAGGGRGAVHKLALPDLRGEAITWSGSRVGAVASTADGERAVALELPAAPSQQARLLLWSGDHWQPLRLSAFPDVSSKVAWLDERRIVYESGQRRLVVADVLTGESHAGPRGSWPASASLRGEWYAVVDAQVVVFPSRDPFQDSPTRLAGFDFGHVTTLRVSQDGQVCSWTQPRFLYRSKGYVQRRGERRARFRALDDGIGAVIGPYSLSWGAG